MPLGGSITFGVGSTDGNGYRRRLVEMLQSHGHTVRMVGSRKNGSMDNNDHEGWRGLRLDQIENKAKASVGRLLPNVFTVNAGSNDCLQEFRLEDMGIRLGNMLEYLWLTSPGSTVVLSTLLANADKEVNSRAQRVNDQIRGLVERKAAEDHRIVLADMYSPQGPSISDLVDDGTHPSDTGYEKMASIWFDSIREAARKGLLQDVITEP